jgi:predicted nucleic-acid-binding protein
MIGLDTNVIVRYVMQDDPKQSQKATRLIEALSSEALDSFRS